MPVNALADVEVEGGGVGLFPALRQGPGKGGQRRGIATDEMIRVPVYGPVHRAQFLQHAAHDLPRSTAKPGVARLNSAFEYVDKCSAILRRGEHLAGDRTVGDVLLVGGGCRLLFFAGRPEAGCGKNETGQHGQARSVGRDSHGKSLLLREHATTAPLLRSRSPSSRTVTGKKRGHLASTTSAPPSTWPWLHALDWSRQVRRSVDASR